MIGKTVTDQWVVHGGAVSSAMARFPEAPAPWVDLSTGINPRPWPVDQVPAFDWTRLPDPQQLAELEATAAHSFGVEANHVCATPGSELCLRLLANAGLPGPFTCLWPAYRTHAEGLPDCRPAAPEELAELAVAPGTLLLANPNNPDGRLLTAVQLLEIAAAKRRAKGWLVVDEAFIDAHPEASIASRVWGGRREHGELPVVVLRSFGKFFGLPGVRLGFLIGPRAIVEQMKALLGSWPLNSAAVEIGRRAYADAAWQAQAREQLAQEAGKLKALLQDHGLKPHGSSPLFQLVEVEEESGGAFGLFEHLARHGILTRPFSYNSRWLRLGLPASMADYARLEAALTAWRTA